MARPDRERFTAPESQGLGMVAVSLVPSAWFCGLALCCVSCPGVVTLQSALGIGCGSLARSCCLEGCEVFTRCCRLSL